jgi:class 3 adenylate cyclase
MRPRSLPKGSSISRPMRGSRLLPFAAGALAVGIFLIDTLTSLQFAVAVLYVVVVLVAATCFQGRGILIAAATCVGLTILSYLLVHGYRLEEAAPLRSAVSVAAICITTVLVLKNLSANERLRETERKRANLTRFFSPHFIDQIVEIDTPLSIARYQTAAVLFVDMIGFTAYSSGKTPATVIAMLRDLLALLSESVFSHRGSVDKFLGDGLMAVFGPPLPSSCDASNAASCACDILQSIDRWNERHHRSGDAAIHVAIGIHYGDVVQGDVGSDKRLELTVIGDTVNIASRVEAYCRSLDAAVLVTDAFHMALRAEGRDDLTGRFAAEGLHTLRGRAEPIHLYSVRRRGQRPVPDGAAIARGTLQGQTVSNARHCECLRRAATEDTALFDHPMEPDPSNGPGNNAD